MAESPFRRAIAVSLLLVLFGFLAGALTGFVIHVTRIADIIVTLAMLFVWAGVALAVLEVPGGGVPPRFQSLITVDTVFTVLPDDMWIIAPSPTRTLTLFACHPRGSAAQRIVAKATYAGPAGA